MFQIYIAILHKKNFYDLNSLKIYLSAILSGIESLILIVYMASIFMTNSFMLAAFTYSKHFVVQLKS